MSVFQTAAQMTGRPFNNIVSFYGDSRVANGILIAGTNYNIQARSIIGWARNLCRQSFRCDTSNIYGTGGHTSAQVLATLQANIDADPAATIAVICSTNDRVAPQQWTAAQTITNLAAIEALVISKGRTMLWLSEMPRGGANVLAGADLAAHLSVVRWILQRSTIPGVYVADTFTPLVDLTSASASPLAGMMGADSLHPSPIGAYTAALQIKGVMDTLFPPRPTLAVGAADLYSADNLRGAMNANPMMNGTGGTVNVGAATVTNNGAAANYTFDFTNCTGLTCTLAKVTAGGKDWQQFTLSGTPTAASPSIRMASTTSIAASITAGDVTEQSGEMEMNASQTGVLSVQMEAILSSMNRRDLAVDVSWPTAALAMVYRLGPFVASAFETGFYKPNFTINLAQNVAVSAVIRVRALAARKVVA